MQNKIVAIYPGRFQFPHPGHRRVYQSVKGYYTQDTWIAMTNCFDDSNSDSPLSFEDRKQLLSLGCQIPTEKIKLVKNPYVCSEIVDLYPDDTIVIFIVGIKDRARFPFFKKDGTPSYLQDWITHKENLKPKSEHAYVQFQYNQVFNVGDISFSSASQCRNHFRVLPTNTQRKQFIKNLYQINNIDTEKCFDKLEKGLVQGSAPIK